MATDETVKIPKWVRGVIITLAVGALTYFANALNANTQAIGDLNITMEKVSSSVDLVRSDTQGTISRLLDKVEVLVKQNEDFEQRLRKLEAIK